MQSILNSVSACFFCSCSALCDSISANKNRCLRNERWKKKSMKHRNAHISWAIVWWSHLSMWLWILNPHQIFWIHKRYTMGSKRANEMVRLWMICLHLAGVFCLYIFIRFAAMPVIERPKFYANPYAKHGTKHKRKHRLANATRASDKIFFVSLIVIIKAFGAWIESNIWFGYFWVWRAHTSMRIFWKDSFLKFWFIFWWDSAMLMHKLLKVEAIVNENPLWISLNHRYLYTDTTFYAHFIALWPFERAYLNSEFRNSFKHFTEKFTLSCNGNETCSNCSSKNRIWKKWRNHLETSNGRSSHNTQLCCLNRRLVSLQIKWKFKLKWPAPNPFVR